MRVAIIDRGRAEAPEFAVEYSREAGTTVNASKTCCPEGIGDVRKTLWAQAGKQAKGEVQGLDIEEPKSSPGLALRDGEIRDDPETAGSDVVGEGVG